MKLLIKCPEAVSLGWPTIKIITKTHPPIAKT
jgi:hypothetical protein